MSTNDNSRTNSKHGGKQRKDNKNEERRIQPSNFVLPAMKPANTTTQHFEKNVLQYNQNVSKPENQGLNQNNQIK